MAAIYFSYTVAITLFMWQV